jgi:hypothetical protein
MAQGTVSMAQFLANMAAVVGVLGSYFGRPLTIEVIAKVIAEYQKTAEAAGIE